MLKEGEEMNDELKNRIMPAVKLLSEVIEKKVNSELKENDITVSQLRVLGVVAKNSTGDVSLKEIEGALHTAQATIAGIVSRLESKKLVVGFFEPNDKRIKKVKLTERGKELIEKTKGKVLDMEATLSSNFSEYEKEELIRLLGKMYDAIK